VTTDFIIDCRVSFDPDIYVEKKTTATGVYAAYAGISGITMLLSATKGGSTPVDASLSKMSEERSGSPGYIHPATPFLVTDLQSYLASYANKVVWLNLFKSGELYYEPFSCMVIADRLSQA
jgi:hypothetical protein